MHDVLIVGAGPAGLTAAIMAARAGASVLVLEGGPKPGRKLLASGGGRCNLTNTLPAEEFMERFGGQGRFMQPALRRLGSQDLRAFLHDLGVETQAPDGFHVFPVGHRARSVLDALTAELDRRGVRLLTNCLVSDLLIEDQRIQGVRTGTETYTAGTVILACGGTGHPALGSGDRALGLAEACGHHRTEAHPGMVPLLTRETWPARCTADTIPRAVLRFKRPGKQRIEGRGDLIFTRTGLAGPVIQDLSREITPFLDEGGEVIVEMRLTGRDQDAWSKLLATARQEAPRQSVIAWLKARGKVPTSLGRVFCEQAEVDPDSLMERFGRKHQTRLAAVLALIRITVIGHAGWDRAMVMRGGVALADVHPETLASRHVSGLHFAGEMLDLDGPCGGFNLQWSFASGCLAGEIAGRRS